ncbi:methyltransferase domain-containing protein [Klebsiella pneumoniae]|uniref:methyltransferase domain-containing protein n=1 Tax=Klebsiella pneumoniae TaxID=573 RepID=UPI001CC028B8|nr:methyltransferase domain-containing protein [Klebsiella pneumoniae]MBZ1999256.1 methyltransferase domain-containing protein [Klebsiella pneumoniae]
MADWNPSLYLQFDAERTRPAADLLSRIAHLQVEHAVDLGCGPGNSTRLLRAAWPLATIVGIDNSPAMLVQAAQALPDCEFIDADIARWRPAQPPDVIYANASLQWLTDHETLFPYLAGLDEQAGSAFLTRYLALLAAHYPLQCNGKVLLRFPRLFIVARKIAA